MGKIGVLSAVMFIVVCIGYFVFDFYPEVFEFGKPQEQSLPEKPIPAASIDTHALQTSARVEQSVETLANYLIQPAANDYDKVRAIYRWMTANISYDSQALFSGNYNAQSPEDVLHSRHAICSGYTALFEALGQGAGLQTMTIGGYSKGYGYSAEANQLNADHAWNAVKLDGQWRLLDVTWGAGYLNEHGQFVRQFSEHYFLTDPQHFIYDHFPEDPQWQLLNPTVSLRQYQEFPTLKPAFFANNLALKSHLNGKITVNSPLQIRLTAPPGVDFTARVRQGNTEFPRSMTFWQKSPEDVILYAAFPQPGSYLLRIFAKPEQEPEQYAWAAEFTIEANTSSPAFPVTYQSFYDSGSYLHEPMTGQLQTGTQHFRLKVPGAEDVAVVMGEQWHTLSKQGSEFVGNVTVQHGEVGVYAKFPGQTQFSGLLQYMGQ